MTLQTTQKKNITLFHNQSKAISASIQDSVRRFEADHPEYSVTLEHAVNETYKNKLASAAATNNLPDVFASWSGGTLNEFVDMNRVTDLRGLLDKYKDKDRFMPRALAQATYKNGTWAVPVDNTVMALIFYNKEIFQRLGLTPPETWAELIATVDKLHANGLVPFALANHSGWPVSMYYMYLVDRLGGPTVFQDTLARTPGSGFDGPVFLEAWKYLKQLMDHHAFPANANIMDEDIGDSRQMMYDEKAAMVLIGTWTLTEMGADHPDFLKKLDFFTFPVLPDGKGASGNLVGSVGDQFYSISSRCKNPDAAYQLIRYLIDDTAVQQRVAAGNAPPLNNVKPTLPMLNRMLQLVQKAPAIQRWYDQTLPPRLAETHKEICRRVIDGLSPEEACRLMEEAAKAYDAGAVP